MKVFISWSGRTSQLVAEAMRSWLPLILHSVKPFVSTEDIGKGQNWNARLTRELSDTSFGLVIVTRANAHSEWLHFEAGALSNSLPEASVCPVLVDLVQADVPGPLSQFQCTTLDHNDLRKLIRSINQGRGSDGLPTSTLDKTFEAFYPELIDAVNKIRAAAADYERPSSSDGPVGSFFSENYVSNSDEFESAMQNATSVSVLGYAQNRMTGAYSAELSAVCSRNGVVRFLLIDPEGQAVQAANLRSYSPKDGPAAKHQHDAALALLASVQRNAECGSLEVRVIDLMPPFTIFIFDESDEDKAQAFVWLMPWREPSRKRPGFRVVRRNDEKWFDLFYRQLQRLWESENARAITLVSE
jgi:hypothetical protein